MICMWDMTSMTCYDIVHLEFEIPRWSNACNESLHCISYRGSAFVFLFHGFTSKVPIKWCEIMIWDILRCSHMWSTLLCHTFQRLCGSAPGKNTPERSSCNVRAGCKKSTAKGWIYGRWRWWATQKRSESSESRVGSPSRIFNARPDASHSRRATKFSKETGGRICKTHCRETLTCIEGYGSITQFQPHQAGQWPIPRNDRNDLNLFDTSDKPESWTWVVSCFFFCVFRFSPLVAASRGSVRLDGISPAPAALMSWALAAPRRWGKRGRRWFGSWRQTPGTGRQWKSVKQQTIRRKHACKKKKRGYKPCNMVSLGYTWFNSRKADFFLKPKIRLRG